MLHPTVHLARLGPCVLEIRLLLPLGSSWASLCQSRLAAACATFTAVPRHMPPSQCQPQIYAHRCNKICSLLRPFICPCLLIHHPRIHSIRNPAIAARATLPSSHPPIPNAGH
ncbi:hypothetical protein P154DRAFT_210913 [Amniculicola lignicola CBS 123094]|uniref:Secreted protein n=1 Tax=Amniculicola lignicola CBS 123094 TaxID=1392246 RepID=A0A6A5WDE0_9PLEO|nr:hypothetical protein P154DRAFT_210913 [Amniculicola lignicola CBS 123094]